MAWIDTLEISKSGPSLGFDPLLDISRLEVHMAVIEQEISRTSSTDGETVSFFNLGFR